MRFNRLFDNRNPVWNLLDRFEDDLRPFQPMFSWDNMTDTADRTFTLAVGTGWTENALNLRVSMPAVTEKDFNLSIHGNRLTIRGERTEPKNFGENGSVTYGLRYGKFERSIELPTGLDLDAMKAKLHHGVLDIHIPMGRESKVRAIPVEVGTLEAAVAAA